MGIMFQNLFQSLAILYVLLFWGYQNNSFTLSILMSAFLIFPLLKDSKNTFPFHLFKLGAFITYFLLATVLYYQISNSVIFFLAKTLKWAPLILLSLITMELYNREKTTPIKALLLFHQDQNYRFSILPYYLFISVLASTLGRPNIYISFYLFFFFLVLIIKTKPKRYHYFSLVLAFLFIFLSAISIQSGMKDLHKKALRSIIQFLMGMHSNRDLSRSRTGIGSIGELKLSNEIKYRLISPLANYPMYLREASYDVYFSGSWIVASKSKFKPIKHTFCPQKSQSTLSATLYGDFDKRSVLPLPTRIQSVPLRFKSFKDENYSKNLMNVIKREGIEVQRIKFHYFKQNHSCLDAPFSLHDLKIPKKERPHIKRFIKEHDIYYDDPPKVILQKLKRIFNTEFAYSLILKSPEKGSPLEEFLFKNKTGHCEYFATTTALILRELGIPARYTIGYSVQEYSELEEAFLIRERHAHSWVRVHLDGQWYNFDTTPSTWASEEHSEYPAYYKIMDFLSFLNHKWNTSKTWQYMNEHYEYSVFILLFIFLVLRYKNRNKSQKKKKIETEFHKKIDRVLKLAKVSRQKSIPLETWLQELTQEEKTRLSYDTLKTIIQLYYIIKYSDEKQTTERLKSLYKKIKHWKLEVKTIKKNKAH